MAGSHNVKPTSWLAVLLIIAGSVLLGFALPMHSVPLAIAGGVALLAGLVTGAVYHIMDDAY
jgi:drug/metabolite transporter (DMT)-like permease